MLGWLKEIVTPRKPREHHDPAFGRLLYMGGYWEGKGHFPPTDDNIEWFIDADEDGPGESQRAVFQQIAARYSEVLPGVYGVLGKHVEEWVRSSTAPELDQVLRLGAISVPEAEAPTMRWELSFDSTLPGTPLFVVSMVGWHPTGEVEVSD